jgi:hypothetical protein
MVAAVAAVCLAPNRRLVRRARTSRILELFEGRLGRRKTPRNCRGGRGLRSAAARQGEQLVSLATAVHRLAKLLAAHPPQDRR